MDTVKQMQAMGLTLPTPLYLVGLLVFGVAGLIVYRRGRKATSPLLKWTGIALMLYPYAVSSEWMLWGAGLALCGLAYAKWE